MSELPEAEWFRERFSYDPETGQVLWITGKRAGRVAGCRHKRSGYTQICVTLPDRRRVGINAHRIAFLLENGKWPEIVDHDNHDEQDNRFGNLKDTDPLGNARNRLISKRNKTGVPGLSKDLKRNRYHLILSSKPRPIQKTFSLRQYGSWEAAFESAKEARLAFDQEHNYKDNWSSLHE